MAYDGAISESCRGDGERPGCDERRGPGYSREDAKVIRTVQGLVWDGSGRVVSGRDLREIKGSTRAGRGEPESGWGGPGDRV